MKKYILIAIVPLMLFAFAAVAAPLGSALTKEVPPDVSTEFRKYDAHAFITAHQASEIVHLRCDGVVSMRIEVQPALHEPNVTLKGGIVKLFVPAVIGRPDTKRHVAWRCRVIKLC